jgi:hypothetical protein
MRVSRIFIFAIFTLMLSAIAIYAAAQADFDQLKSLEGNWVGKTSTGENANVTYTLTAGGSAVMENSQGPHGENMITMYHQNNGKIMMTHYCMLNNQPRMESAGSSTPNQIAFNFVDGTNMSDAKATHMHKLVITFKDKDHFSQEWTLLDKGQEKPMVFEFERAK